MRARPRLGYALLLGVALLAVLGAGACTDDGDEASTPPEPAPDFTLSGLDGGEVSLASLRGKTVVIDFWATWCPPCEFQVPVLNDFFEKHAGQSDVAVLGISIDTEGPEVVSAWAKEKGVEYPILVGGDSLARRFGAVGFPTVVVVTPEGDIAMRHTGLIELDDLEDAVAPHL